MIRTPAVASDAYPAAFYPASPERLRQVVRGLLREDAEKDEAIGALCPHAGYGASGPVAGHLYSRIKIKDTFVIIGPNHTGVGDSFSIMTEGTWRMPFGDVEIDAGLGRAILAGSKYLKEDFAAHVDEHSVEVQLPFLQYLNPKVKFVPVVLAPASLDVYREIGNAIAGAVKETGRDAVVLASGDMTHYEPQASARARDMKAIEAMVNMDEEALAKRVQEYSISMCALPSVATMLTAARGLGADSAELIDYRTSGDILGNYSSVVGYAAMVFRRMSPFVRLAKDTVEAYVRERQRPVPGDAPPEMQGRAGVFVSIHKLGGLRGCIGTFEPTRHTIAEEIIANAISSATRDPRFEPVTPDELPLLNYSVDVLTSPEPVKDKSELDAKKYGVITRCGYRTGLLLPALEGVESVDEQIDICCQKAGIAPGEPVQLYRFEVKRYK